MKRRSLLHSVAAAPVLAALPVPAQAQEPARPASDSIQLDSSSPDQVGRPVPRFLSTEQFRALEKLGALLVPRVGDRPGSRESGVPEFLDFLLSESGAERQTLYRSGLDRLNAEAHRLYQKPFAELGASDADAILKPLSQPWTYDGPSDPFARFLLASKEDLLRATINSRPYGEALSRVTRGGSGTGYYWLPVE
jgi:hypothetical protein